MVLNYGKHPTKAIYIGFQLAKTLFVSIPVWLVVSLPRSWRPSKSWSYSRTVAVQLLRRLLDVSEHTGSLVPSKPHHKSIRPGKNVNGVWIEPAPSQTLTDDLKIWADAASVAPASIPGYWQNKDNTTIDTTFFAREGEKVILSFHGGGYYTGSAHPSDLSSKPVRDILASSRGSVRLALTVEYRLSTTYPHVPTNPFPAALLDAIAAYHYLIHQKRFKAENIIVEGDSAGGNLALALTRYLVENKQQRQVSPHFPSAPGALLLLSPWCDIGTSHDVNPHTSLLANDYDPEPTRVGYAKLAYTGLWGMGAAEVNPYISPSSLYIKSSASTSDLGTVGFGNVTFTGFPRTFISVGGLENLRYQIRVLRDRLRKDIGEKDVAYFEAGTAPHDFLVFDGWSEPERGDTLREIGKWLNLGDV